MLAARPYDAPGLDPPVVEKAWKWDSKVPNTFDSCAKEGHFRGEAPHSRASKLPEHRLGHGGQTTLMVRNIPVRYTQVCGLKPCVYSQVTKQKR